MSEAPVGEFDLQIAAHVDAIRVLIRPDWVLAVVAVNADGIPYFLTTTDLQPYLQSFVRQIATGKADTLWP